MALVSGFALCTVELAGVLTLLMALQERGVAFHLGKAALQWTSDAPSSALWTALLLHGLCVAPGAWPPQLGTQHGCCLGHPFLAVAQS